MTLKQMKSGCGAGGSALPWGGRGRKFKSCHSDQRRVHPCAIYAGMAELADALDSGSSESNFMEVQVLLSAPRGLIQSNLFSFAPKRERIQRFSPLFVKITPLLHLPVCHLVPLKALLCPLLCNLLNKKLNHLSRKPYFH